MHNKTSCYIQHICKKLNFHNGMKSGVALSHTRPCCVVFLRCINTRGHAYIYNEIRNKKTLLFALHIHKNLRFHNKNETYRHTKRRMTLDKFTPQTCKRTAPHGCSKLEHSNDMVHHPRCAR